MGYGEVTQVLLEKLVGPRFAIRICVYTFVFSLSKQPQSKDLKPSDAGRFGAFAILPAAVTGITNSVSFVLTIWFGVSPIPVQRAPRKNDRTRIPVQLFIDECKKADSLGIYVQAICLDSDAFVGKTGWSHMHKALHDSLPGKLYTYMVFEYTLNSAHALQYQIFLLLWTIESGSLA